MEILETQGTTKTSQGLDVTNLKCRVTEGVDIYYKNYVLNVFFQIEDKYEQFNIIKEDENGNVERFNQYITIPFDDVTGIDDVLVSETITSVLMAKLEEQLADFGLTINNG